jgi:hypothetical protein
MLVECAWSYEHLPRVGKDKQEFDRLFACRFFLRQRYAGERV